MMPTLFHRRRSSDVRGCGCGCGCGGSAAGGGCRFSAGCGDDNDRRAAAGGWSVRMTPPPGASPPSSRIWWPRSPRAIIPVWSRHRVRRFRGRWGTTDITGSSTIVNGNPLSRVINGATIPSTASPNPTTTMPARRNIFACVSPKVINGRPFRRNMSIR